MQNLFRMKKAIILVTFFTLTGFIRPANEVYICNSKSATKYHYKETCRGLNACKHDVVKIKLDEAKTNGYGLCGWED